jgi:hypothetical protein
VRQHLGNIARQLTDDARRPAVGAHPERIGTLDVQEVGHFVQLAGDFGVHDRHGKLCPVLAGDAAPAAGLLP